MTMVGATVLLAAMGGAATASTSATRPQGLSGFSLVAAPVGGGSLLAGTIPSATAPRPLRSGFVYLPPHFERSVRYPVVYLLHGMPGSPGEYTGALDILHVADALIARGEARPFIAVMPAAGPNARYNGEWTGPWESYVVADVVPWVDRNFPTLANPAGRTIAGLSAGGYGAADIGLRSPQLFGRIMSWSSYFHPLRDGSLAHADHRVLVANDAFRLLVLRARRLRVLGTRFFVSSGPTHSHWFTEKQTSDFIVELRRLGLPVSSMRLSSNERVYAKQLTSGLRWALGRRAVA